ncbi:hypothetical protein [Alteromonas confluentis]|uniref:Uncharacterized protein n=1 Tax=Alteromonas confluentis TaxID=1656094 RepID=A0A1E7ZER8_9ALTE|nr:hypothetical protein [Alteromonas confluentis]OFC72015.1 hypothetical protein BFC18_04740 [Alteromonas confluentis]
MTLVMLHGSVSAERISNASSFTANQFKQFLKQKKVFYSKKRVSTLLLHHYRFLMSLSSISVNGRPDTDILSWGSGGNGLPVMHCLRADIQDLSGCCPWVGECGNQKCSEIVCLGKLLASQTICEIYEVEQRRLHNYIGPVMNKSSRFFYLLQRYCDYQKSLLFSRVNALALSGKDEGRIAHTCILTIKGYQSDLLGML